MPTEYGSAVLELQSKEQQQGLNMSNHLDTKNRLPVIPVGAMHLQT